MSPEEACAQRLAERINRRLGHASITTMMDRYGQLFPSAESALADALDSTYDGAENVIPLDVADGATVAL